MQTEQLLEKKMPFEEFGLRPEILRAVAEKKYTTPTPIQEKAIPIVLEGKAPTGRSFSSADATKASTSASAGTWPTPRFRSVITS